MAAGERDDHERDPVAAGEVLAVLAVDRVADPFACGAVHHHLGEEAEVACRRQRHVLQRNADPLALPGGVAVPQRGDDGQRRVDAACDVPRRQHVVDRGGELGRTGHHRKAEAGVDGVVHPRAAVGAPGHLDVDQVGPQPRQVVIRMPFAPCHIRDQHTAVGDQALHEVLAFGRPQVGRHGPLALVQPRPVDARPVVGDRPAVVVGRAADRVHPHHLGTELTQRHTRPAAPRRSWRSRRCGPRPGIGLRTHRSSYQARYPREPASDPSAISLSEAGLVALTGQFYGCGLNRLLRQQHLQRGVTQRDEAVPAGDPVHGAGVAVLEQRGEDAFAHSPGFSGFVDDERLAR